MTFAVALSISFAAVLLAQIVKGTVGFGGALVAVPFLVQAWGPTQGLFFAASCDVVAGAYLLYGARRMVQWSLVLLMLLPLLAAQFLGVQVLMFLDPADFRVMLAVLIALLGVEMTLRPVRKGRGSLMRLDPEHQLERKMAVLTGFIAGILSGLFAIPGPPVAYYGRTFLAPKFMRATIIALFFPAAFTLSVLLGTRANFPINGDTALVLATLLPAIFIGGRIGTGLSDRLDPKTFGRVVGMILVFSALALFVR